MACGHKTHRYATEKTLKWLSRVTPSASLSYKFWRYSGNVYTVRESQFSSTLKMFILSCVGGRCNPEQYRLSENSNLEPFNVLLPER
jgi:hypothetical protein